MNQITRQSSHSFPQKGGTVPAAILKRDSQNSWTSVFFDNAEENELHTDNNADFTFLHTPSEYEWNNKFYQLIQLPTNTVWQIILVISIVINYFWTTFFFIFICDGEPFFNYSMYITDLLYLVDFSLAVVQRCTKIITSAVGVEERSVSALVVDAITLLPMEIVYYYIARPDLAWSVLFSLRAVSFLRLYRVNVYFTDWGDRPRASHWTLFFNKFMLYLAFVLHTVGCLWYISSCKWRQCDANEKSWMKSTPPGELENDTPYSSMYLLCIYYAIESVANSGLGDMVGNNELEKVVCTVSMFVGFALMIGLFIGSLSSNLVNKGRRRSLFVDKLRSINKHLTIIGVRPRRIRKIMKYYDVMWFKKRGVKEAVEVSLLPLPLQMEVFFDINIARFRSSLIFRDKDESFLRRLSLYMKNEFYLPGENIYYKNVAKLKMICISKGVVEILSDEDDESPIISLTGGTCLGEISLTTTISAKSSVRAATYTELQVLYKVDFLRMIANYPSDVYQDIRAKVDTRISSAYNKEISIEKGEIMINMFVSQSRDMKPIKNLKNRLRSAGRINSTAKITNIEAKVEKDSDVLYSDMYRLEDGVLLYMTSCFYDICNEESWFDVTLSQDFINPNSIDDDPIVKYDNPCIISMYYALSLLSGIGFGDILPESENDVYYACGIIMAGVMLCGYCIAEFSSTFTHKSRARVEYHSTVQAVKKFMEANSLGSEIMGRVINYYQLQWNYNGGVSVLKGEHILADMSKEIQREVLAQECLKTILNIPLFKLVSADFVHLIAANARLLILPPREVITYVGGLSREMYIIMDGFCEIMFGNTGLKTMMGPNSHFGDIEMLYGVPSIVHVRSVTHCKVVCIGYADYSQEMMKELVDFMKKETVDKDLQKRLVEHFEYEWKRMTGINVNEMADRLNTALKEDMVLWLYENTLREVPLFENVDTSFFKVVGTEMREKYFLRGETIIRSNDVQSDMFIIHRGKVEVLSTYNEMLTCMGAGGIFGNIGMSAACCSVTIVASRNLDVLVIKSETFYNILKRYPSIQKKMESVLKTAKDFIMPVTIDSIDPSDMAIEFETSDHSDVNSPLDTRRSSAATVRTNFTVTTMGTVRTTATGANLFHPKGWFHFVILPESIIFTVMSYVVLLASYNREKFDKIGCPMGKCKVYSWSYYVSNFPDTPAYRYLTCIYFVTSLVTTTSYGDIIAHCTNELLLVLLMMLTSKFAIALFIGDITSVVSSYTSTLVNYEYGIIELRDFLKNQNLSDHPMEKMWTYVQRLWKHGRGKQMPRFVLMAPFVLKCELMNAMYGHHLRNSYIFHNANKDFLRQLTVRLQRYIFFKGNYIVQNGDTDQNMYFIHRGEVEILTVHPDLTETIYDTLKPGDMFGVVQGLYYGIPHHFSFRAKTSLVDILYLNLDSWYTMLRYFEDVSELIYQRANNLYSSM
uniref:Cyclic nucleotide-binding domain-containing protein n=1 Tax=Timema bartmani TaxID=61472 RepID=A0A7R9I9C3_9NEOP|nr:unnamed protein product [Timema bartmani]